MAASKSAQGPQQGPRISWKGEGFLTTVHKSDAS